MSSPFNGIILSLFLLDGISSFSQVSITSASIKTNLIREVQQHPDIKVEDLYKFIHQAAFGSEHAVKDTLAVRQWMKTEIAGLDLSQIDPLSVPLSPDGKIVRINLRPWLNAGKDTEVLLRAFILTANLHPASPDSFRLYRECARDMAKSKTFMFSAREMDRFFRKKEKLGFPAVHHSKFYEEKYKPAYRVIDMQYLKGYTD